MNKLLLCYVMFCFVLKSNSQNLVPNWSFEQNIDCSTPVLRNAVDWCSVGDNCTYYYSCESNAYYQTPYQYFNSCLQSYQIPKTGQAYTAIYGYISTSTMTPNRYAQAKLVDTLKASKIYCVSFYLSLWNFSQYSTDKIGAVLTPTPFPCLPPATSPNYTVTGVIPHVVSSPSIQLDDTLNWMEVSAIYTSNGTETYITIGDFFLQSQHSIVQSYPTNCNAVAVYYLDDVSVEEVQIAKARNDTLIYALDSVIIGNNASEAAIFNWQPGTGLSCTNCPNPKASPSVTTTYTVTKTQCKVTTTDVITVSVSLTGLDELSMIHGMQVKLFPNPSNGNFTLSYDLQKETAIDVLVTDISGKLVYKIALDDLNNLQTIDLSNVQNGIYFVQLINKQSKLLWTDKVVISK